MAPCFLPVRPRVLSMSHQVSPAPGRAGRVCKVGAAPAPGDLSQKVKRTSSQCPLQEEAQPFPPNFGAFQQDSEWWDGCLSPMASCVPCGDRDTEANVPSPGAHRENAILHLDLYIASLEELMDLDSHGHSQEPPEKITALNSRRNPAWLNERFGFCPAELGLDVTLAFLSLFIWYLRGTKTKGKK